MGVRGLCRFQLGVRVGVRVGVRLHLLPPIRVPRCVGFSHREDAVTRHVERGAAARGRIEDGTHVGRGTAAPQRAQLEPTAAAAIAVVVDHTVELTRRPESQRAKEDAADETSGLLGHCGRERRNYQARSWESNANLPSALMNDSSYS